MSTHADAFPDVLILAAVDRATHHRPGEGAVIKASIYLHLAIPIRSGPARHVYRRLQVLEAAGLVERSRRRGLEVWGLTATGGRRLQRAQRAGEVELPESPQHEAWRSSRILAEQEIDRCRRELRRGLGDALRVLDVDPPARSDAFFELAEQLERGCRRVASATYCLYEWAEPDDATPDINDNLDPSERTLPRAEQALLRSIRVGRRGIRQWDRYA
jgi:hypothetical protein